MPRPMKLQHIGLQSDCETNCETFVHVDTESVTHKMAVLLQIDWSVVHTK